MFAISGQGRTRGGNGSFGGQKCRTAGKTSACPRRQVERQPTLSFWQVRTLDSPLISLFFATTLFFSILHSIAKPSDEEMELAQKVRENLVEMSAKVQPKFVASSEGIRKALGSTDLPQPAPGIVSVVPAPVAIPAAAPPAVAAPPGAVPIPMDVTF